MSTRIHRHSVGLSALLVLTLLGSTEGAASSDEETFSKRLAALRKANRPSIAVTMKPTDDPSAVPESGPPAGSPVPITGGRMDIYTPPLISPDDIQAVIQKHMVDVRVCYKKQLAEDPTWADRLILDLAIKKTGRVSEVSIAPRRVLRAAIGKCLVASVPNWTFPKFTGETDDGITQEVVTASFPFSFSVD